MALEGQTEVFCNLLSVGTLTLQTFELDPEGIAVSGDMLMVTDSMACNVHLYRCHDGKLLATSDRLEARPLGICFINNEKICVTLLNCTLEIMAIKQTKDRSVITVEKEFRVNSQFDLCHGVAGCIDSIVVCGSKNDTICWCTIFLNGEQVGTVHKIAFGKWNVSQLTRNDSMVFISCNAGYGSLYNGVYAYDIKNSSKETFIYKHKDLNVPTGITLDSEGFLFVCNSESTNYCIHHLHHLRDKCELVTIYREGIPSHPHAIFLDHGNLYVACRMSNVINQYKPVYAHQQDPDHQSTLVDKGQSSVDTEMSTSVLVPEDFEDVRQGNGGQKAPEILGSDGRKQLFTAETSAKTEQGNLTNYPDLTAPEKCKLFLPPGMKYHVFFIFTTEDIQWVKETVKRLENDHGFVCCEYDRDNSPGAPILMFAADSIKYAIKTVVVMTEKAFKSNFVQYDIQMALIQDLTERKCVVPVLLQNCAVPIYLRILNYIDARDHNQRDIWWPQLLTELLTQTGNDSAPKVIESNQKNQHLNEKTSKQLEQGDSKEEQQREEPGFEKGQEEEDP